MKAMKLLLAMWLAGVMAWTESAWGGVFGSSGAVTVRSLGGYNVEGHALVGYPPFQVGRDDEAGVWLDGAVLFSSVGETTFDWHPQTLGAHVLEFRLNGVSVTSKTVNVKSLAFSTPPGPKPPTAEDGNLSITPMTRNFGTGGGGAAIVVNGSGTWQASVSDNWITLNTTSGAAGEEPVAYLVGATTNAEGRTGYVYVGGHVHTVTQNGLGATISPTSASFELEGGTGTISVTPPERGCWQARANVDWVIVTPKSGTGTGSVSYTVAPMSDVKTRQGTLTVAGQTFTVFQYGRRMSIAPMLATCDYLPHTISISVEALSSTAWSVASGMNWISVADAGPGTGSGAVSLSIAENPSWLDRAGTVSIGTETFLVTQKGRSALEFGLSPAKTTASVEGANGLIAVTATPDLPWSAKSNKSWLTLDSGTASGEGNGTVAYSAAPNRTLNNRTGKIVVTPGDTNVAAKTHTVTQPAAESALSAEGYEFEALGFESCEVGVSLSDIVRWSIENTNEWLTVEGTTNRVGPGTVVLWVDPNDSVYPRSGTVTIARKSFKVSQKGWGVEVEYDTKLFGADGGYDTISVHPEDEAASWTAVSSDKTWITIFQGDSGVGDGEILYIVSPYVGDGGARTGTITVGDKVVYISQRTYDLSIDPAGAVVAGINGTGEFGVAAGIGDAWTAIVTEPWITLADGYDAGTGDGVVRFVYTGNDTGNTRAGKIIVAGEVYTLEQRAREFVTVAFDANGGTCGTAAKTYTEGLAYGTLPTPEWTGLVFLGWFTAQEEGELVTVESVVEAAADKTLWAHWTDRQTVTFDANGGTCKKTSLTAVVGKTYTKLASATREGYKFVGWYDAQEGGNRVKIGDSVPPQAERILWARWEGLPQTVHFDANGGTCKTSSRTAVVGETYTKLASATREEYKFVGWYDAQEGGNRVKIGDPVSPQTERTLFAHWEGLTQTVLFNANGGTCKTSSRTAVVGETYTKLASATREGYQFMGWYDAQEGGNRVKIGDPVTPPSERTLWARWKGHPQTVRFDANGGTCSKTSATYYFGETYSGFKTASLNGFKFMGWYDAQEGGKRVKNGMAVTEDAERTLYAHWQATAGTLSITGFSRSSRTARDARVPVTECTIQIEAAAGVTYEIQWTLALDGEWTALRRWTADADGETAVPVSVPVDSLTGFFRVVATE